MCQVGNTIIIKPSYKKYNDYFSDNESNKIAKLDLDLIIRLDFRITKGKILNSCKYGIWSFHHGDNAKYRGGPAGFWEVLSNENLTGVTLQVLNDILDGGKIIEKGFYNTQWSYIKNYNYISEKSILLFKKNIRLLYNNKFNYKSSNISDSLIYKKPKFFDLIKYISIILNKILIKIFKKLFIKLSRYRILFDRWKIILGNGNFDNLDLINFKIIEPPKKHFWADPFLITKDNNEYVFFENYSYSDKKGKISCITLNNRNIIKIEDVLNEEYHLSFPHIFTIDQNYFMIPDSSKAKKLSIYKCISFPNSWELHASIFHGESVSDPIIFKDDNGIFWLFCNKSEDVYNDHNSELYIYQVDNILTFQNIKSHYLNPVIINSEYSRNGGNIFINNQKIIRTSQSSINSFYGKKINFHEITKLNLFEYEERLIKSIKPDFHKNIHSTHHISFDNNKYVIDACFNFEIK